jgi:tetratricopeptide (TPR) repeat protein
VVGVAFLFAMLSATAAAWRRLPELAFALLWVMITLFPVSNLVLISGITLAERTLFLPSVGAMLAVGSVLATVLASDAFRSVATRRALAALGATLLAVACVRSALRQPVWRSSRSVEAQALRDSPLSYRTHWWRGRRLYLARDLDGAQREFGESLQLFDGDPRVLSAIANHYSALNRCDEAIRLYRRSLALDPGQRWLPQRIIHCLVDLGRLDEARREVSAALARQDPFVEDEMTRLDSLARVTK